MYVAKPRNSEARVWLRCGEDRESYKMWNFIPGLGVKNSESLVNRRIGSLVEG
jgi:hypothetical protein